MNLYRNLHEKHPVHEMLTFHTLESMNTMNSPPDFVGGGDSLILNFVETNT